MDAKRVSAIYVCACFLMLALNVNYMQTQDIQAILKGMTFKDKVMFLADFLFNHKATCQQLEDILVAAIPILEFDHPPELFINVVLPWALDILPDILKNYEFLGIMEIIITEINNHTISSDYLLNGRNSAIDGDEGRAYFMKKLFAVLDYHGMASDILANKSVRDFFPYASTNRTLWEQCYNGTMAFIDSLLFGEELALNKHIRFEETPQNHTVMMGNGATLECKIDGPLNPSITWYKVMKDGSRYAIYTDITAIEHGSQLHIDRVTTTTEGQYVCQGHNGVENIEQTAYLSTYGPPHIKPPGIVTANKGQNIKLKCEAEAHPPATFTWKYPPGVTYAYMDTDGTLVVLNAQPTDATYFICIATNIYGSDQATLTLQVKVPPESTIVPEKIPVVPGSGNIALECKPGGDPPLTVTWSKDGQPLTGNGHVFVLAGNVLLVNQPTAADFGVYDCSVSNSLGTSTSLSYAYDNRGSVTCDATFTVCNNTVCGAICPANCVSDTTPVIGYLQYQMDSSICKAGIQSGVIPATGGLVIWQTSHNSTSFSAANQNGISSQAANAAPGVHSVIPVR